MKPLAIFAAIILVGVATLLVSIDHGASHSNERTPAPSMRVDSAPARPPLLAPQPELPREALPRAAHLEVGSAPPERTAETEIAERGVQLQARFDAQSVDASWAMQSRQLLSADLGKYTNADVRVRDVECRSSLCRIALASTDRTAQQTFVEEWVRHRTWTGSGFAVQDGDATIVYVSKPGVDLLD